VEHDNECAKLVDFFMRCSGTKHCCMDSIRSVFETSLREFFFIGIPPAATMDVVAVGSLRRGVCFQVIPA